MMCYRDTTFCTEEDCQKFDTCDRALTQEVKEKAVQWWGCDDTPICVYVVAPACFEEKNNDI